MIIHSADDIACQPFFFQVPTSFAGCTFYLKLEGLNIAGSIKLKTALHLINGLIAEKKIHPHTSKIVESSSGNLGVALSIVCKAKGLPFTCVTDPNINPSNIKLMNLYGAHVICVTERDKNGGYLGTRIDRIHSMLKDDPDLIWTNQYANPDNKNAHYLTTAKEIDDNFPKIDYIFIGAGTTGTLMGCAQYFKNHVKGVKIIAVDAEGSVTFNLPPKKRHIPGLGTSQRPPILDTNFIDEVIIVNEKETIKSCHDFVESAGLLVGGSTGTVLHAVRTKAKEFKQDDVIIALSPDFGERYLNTIYDSTWVTEKIG